MIFNIQFPKMSNYEVIEGSCKYSFVYTNWDICTEKIKMLKVSDI